MGMCRLLGVLGLRFVVHEGETQERRLEGQMPRVFHYEGQ